LILDKLAKEATGKYYTFEAIMAKRLTFRSEDELYHADTCEPLKQAVTDGRVKLKALGRGSYPGDRLPPRDMQELCMAGFWNASAQQDWGLDWHCNEGIEIGYVAAGSLPFEVGTKSMRVQPGFLTITRPWQKHRVGEPEVCASHYSWIILDVGVRRPNQPWQWPKWLLSSAEELDELTSMLRQNEEPVWQGSTKIADCFARLDETVSGGNSASNLALLKIVINELILRLGELLRERKPRLDASLHGSERTVKLFLNALKERLDEPWTLEQMARECGLARTQFANLCRTIVNLSPVDYLIQARLEKAADLLRHREQASITDIAFACGFQSSQHFANSFRRKHGCSPSRYRKTVLL